ncbi:hypothetical protein ACIBEA_41450 [Streptomyces sp. NPDC051555]|uniref:hypothetical protein n=1 Tax=Streptomyces sp. NPDC051555 TaxID=3365657 RepID=UPI003796D2C0
MQTAMVLNPLNLPLIDVAGFATGQNYTDPDHVAALTASMAARGWQGPPLVVLPDYARSYSGTHRLAAAEAAELDMVPGVDLAALFEAVGLDLDEICEDEDLGLLSDRAAILDHLPADTRAAYGVDDIED